MCVKKFDIVVGLNFIFWYVGYVEDGEVYCDVVGDRNVVVGDEVEVVFMNCLV